MDYLVMPKIGVNFFISGVGYKDFDLDEVTAKLGIEPTRTQKQEVLRNGTVKPTYWLFALPKVEALAIDDRMNEMRLILSGKKDIIKQLCESKGLRATFEVTITAASDELPEIYITSDFNAFAGELNADIGIAMYLDCD